MIDRPFLILALNEHRGRRATLALIAVGFAVGLAAGLWPAAAAGQTSTVAPPSTATTQPPATSGPTETAGPTVTTEPTEPTETSEPTAPATPTYEKPAPDRNGWYSDDTEVYLPELRFLGKAEACTPVVTLQNVGSEPAKAVMLLWDAPPSAKARSERCELDCGPSVVQCSGLIKPGQGWTMLPKQLSAGSKSGVVYSVSTQLLSDYGLDTVFGFDDVIADLLCDKLSVIVVDNCIMYKQFQRDWRNAGITHWLLAGTNTYAGLPLDYARGAPLAVRVERTCQAGTAISPATMASSYNGVPAARLGRFDELAPGYAFGYAAPIVYGGANGQRSYVTVQLAYDFCAVVELTLQRHIGRDGGDGGEDETCPEVVSCGRVQLGPGNSHTFDVAACVGPDGGRYAGTITAWKPLAAIVDTVVEGSLSSYSAVPLGLEWVADPYDPDGAEVSIGGTVAYGPVVYGSPAADQPALPYWSSRIHVQNHSTTADAKVKLYLLDRSGDTIATLVDWVCPRGGVMWDLDGLTSDLNGWRGGARVESQAWFAPGVPLVEPPPISAVVENLRIDPGEGGDAPSVGQAYSYRMLTEAEAYDWPTGRANGGTLSGAGLIALPRLVLGATDNDGASEISIANLAPKPGFTDFVVYLYDQNGLVDFLCARLNERQTELVDLRYLGTALGPGFQGSAVISATYWEHDVFAGDGQHVANLVGLGVVSALRSSAAVRSTVHADPEQVQAVADTSVGSVGIPIGTENWQSFGANLPPCPGAEPPDQPPLSTRTPGPTPTPVPTTTPEWAPDPASLAGSREVFAPALRYAVGDGETCATEIRVQNAGREPSKVVALFWTDPEHTDGNGIPCDDRCAPFRIECSGLIRPGSTWTFVDANVPAGAKSAALYSFNVKPVDAYPFSIDDIWADLMCETLRFGVVDDCSDYTIFKQAYEDGAIFAGIPMTLTYGAAVAVEVARDCDVVDSDPHASRASTYVGVAHDRLGRAAAPSDAFAYSVPIVHSADDRMRTVAQIQNAGDTCAAVDVTFVSQAQCGEPRLCGTFEIPAGASRTVDLSACAGTDGDGGAWVSGDQPLAITTDSVFDDALLSQTAAPVSDGSMPDGDGHLWLVGDQTAWAPVVYNNYLSLAPDRDIAWTTRLHAQNQSNIDRARIRLSFVDRAGDVVSVLTEWVCPRGSLTIDLARVAAVPDNWIGSVRVESQAWHAPTKPEVAPPAIRAVAENVRAWWPAVGEWTRPIVTEGYGYRLVGEAEGFDAAVGHGRGGLTSGVGLIAVPSLPGRPHDSGPTHEIGITNLVTKPGFTDFLFLVYDQNGLLDLLCDKLNEGQTEYIDLTTWGYLNDAFVGSAVISATFWEHDIFASDGRFLRNLVGLSAVSAVRPFLSRGAPYEPPAGDEDGPGDVSTGGLSVPFRLGETTGPDVGPGPWCPSGPITRPTRTPTPTGPIPPTPTQAPPDQPYVVFLPIVS